MKTFMTSKLDYNPKKTVQRIKMDGLVSEGECS